MFQLSKAVRQLFYINIAVFIIGYLLESVNFPFIQSFALLPKEGFMPHQLITHMFLHGGILHIVFNMLALISIAPPVEDYFGYRKFILYYLLCGLGGAFLHMFMVNSSVPMLGASGAIFGIVLIFTILNPNQKLFLFGIFGMKAKYIFSLMLAGELYAAFCIHGDGIGHFCHLGGALTGALLLAFDKYVLSQLPQETKKRWS